MADTITSLLAPVSEFLTGGHQLQLVLGPGETIEQITLQFADVIGSFSRTTP